MTKKSTFFFRTSPTLKLTPFRSSCLSLNDTDKIRVIDMKKNLVDIIRRCIKSSWLPGIVSENDFYGSLEFDLNGNPFSTSGSSNESIYTCQMMMIILAALEVEGLQFYTSADLSGKCETRNKETYSVDLHSWFFIDRSKV